jgi:lipopolysaccharide transport system permease protein
MTETMSLSAPARPTILKDLREVVTDLWSFRELLTQLAKRDIKIRYKQAVMGFGWALFMPILVVLAGLIVRLALSYAGGGTVDRAAAGALAVKGIGWSFFVGTIGFATTSLTANMTLVTKVYFPREVLPIAALTAQGFDSSIAGLALLVALPFLGLTVSPALLWLPVLTFLLVAFTAGMSLLLSCANLFFRDVKYIVQVCLTFGIFFTPVLFEASVLGPRGAKLVMLNPLAPILEGMRLAVIGGHSLLVPVLETSTKGLTVVAWQPWYLAYAAIWALGMLGVSGVVFHRAEFAFAEYV